VPKVLRSGDHGAIARWREAQKRERTRLRRPDLWRRWLERQAEPETRCPPLRECPEAAAPERTPRE
jgi:tRNA G37 N-methylase TrmD